jgi:diguanylate cyclase (GGDEF)-like protein/PAS domain S-box-containing protein
MGETTKLSSTRAPVLGGKAGAHANGLRTNGHANGNSLSRALLEASVDCVVAVDTQGRIVEWNAAAERTFGHSREVAMGAQCAELILPPDSRQRHRRNLGEMAADPNAPMIGTRVERIAVRASGEQFPIEVTVARVDGPEPVAVGFIRDISEHKREQARSDANARRRAAMTAIGHQVLRNAPLEQIGIAVAIFAREELEVDVVRIWRPADEGARMALVASAGPADEALHGPPPMPTTESGSHELPDGVVCRLVTPDGPATAIALHTETSREFTADELGVLESLCQMMIASISHHTTLEELEQAENRYRGLIERLPIVSYLAEYGSAGAWLFISPQIENLIGYTADEWLADKNLWWNHIHPDDRDRVQAAEEHCVETLDSLSIEYRMVARDGRIVWIRDEGAFGRRGGQDQVLVEGVLMDVTQRRQAVDELRHRADHDELTGLANRRRFIDELQRRRAASKPRGAVAIVDVDDLKYINDSLGHAAGDGLLRSVASSLGEALRPGDFLARFGGDEFTILLDVENDEAARRRLAGLLRAVRGRQSQTTARASSGAVMFDPDTASTDEDLIIAADIALHSAKERGGDRYEIFTGSGSERLAWVGHLRSAIDNDRLALYRQPIIDLASGEPSADEILVRMVEADGTVLPPSAFLPTAERFGLIRELDRWVIERAIGAAAASGRTMTINLSARSISDPGLSGHIRYAIERSGLDPSTVVFELTETAAATASEDLREFGARIERLGCSLAIDDFGTGFGSLTYLKNLPVRFLKVDMEFVRGINDSAADRAIVQSIVTIAKSLGMRTIGEGVEDEQTLERLAALGVDFAQGYHLGRPAPWADA